MRVRPATHDDLEFILDNPSHITQADFDDLGVDIETIKAAAHQMFSVAANAEVLVSDESEQPICLFMLNEYDGPEPPYTTTFLSTERYANGGFAMLRFGRKYIANLFRRFGTLITITSAPYGGLSAKYLRVHGYEYRGKLENDKFLFIYNGGGDTVRT